MSENKYQALREQLTYAPKNGHARISDQGKTEMEAYCKRYMAFLNAAKTEREAVRETVRQAEAAGFRPYTPGMEMTPGTKVYSVNHAKAINLAVIGKKSLAEGTRITAAHIDNPRLDLKPNPLYEDSELAFFKTHYYGGIKKYQWTTVPMAIHGVVAKKDGTVVEICIGEKDDDPIFIVTDLLIHLSEEQMKKSLATGVTGENLNLLVGSMPMPEDDGADSVKLAVLYYLHETYGITEEDFLSAELTLTPAAKARELGFDRSMIAAYGHDDRVCAYPSMAAVLNYEGTPEYTLAAVLTDKEEIGSVGATGMGAMYFENTMAELIACVTGEDKPLTLRRCLQNSRMLSSDVSAGFDPNFAGVFEKRNASIVGNGVTFNKFTGSRGKSGSNDANAEFVAQVRRICDEANVCWQTAELGKVDVGGGGTIAYICAKYGMNVIDCGIPVLSMHAPWEVISKVDLWEEYKCYCAFLKGAREF